MTPKIVTHENVHKWANHLKYFSQYGISTVRCTRQFFFFFLRKGQTVQNTLILIGLFKES